MRDKKWKLLGLVCASVALIAALAMVGCSGNNASSESAAGDAAAEAVADLTVTPGKLTIATGNPAYPPYVMNDAPESGEGFEAAIAYAVAEKMGFAPEDVVWVRTQSPRAPRTGI